MYLHEFFPGIDFFSFQVTYPVTSKQSDKIVQIHMRHPVDIKHGLTIIKVYNFKIFDPNVRCFSIKHAKVANITFK